jgi:solute carrier family 25 carnitine/acylcarnitine transporter 20/29
MSADFWAGYVSGAVGIIIGNPLDLIKTRLQAGKTALNADAASAGSTPQSFRGQFENAGTLVRGEQTQASLYLDSSKANLKSSSPILGYGALNALLFVTYNRTLSLINTSSSADLPPSYTKIWLAGATGGLASFVVSAPTELIKCRAQVSTEQNVSSWTIAREVWRRDGVRGLYYGGGVTSVRDAVGYGF